MLVTKAEVVTPTQRATLVAFRPSTGEGSADVVKRLAEARIMVRDIPATGLIRASVGWWTSEGDLDRLVDRL